ERELDAAETALVVLAPVQAGLDDRGGQGVEVQQRDLPVGDAVRRGELVELRPRRDLGPREAPAFPVDAPPTAVFLALRPFAAQHVRRLGHVVGGEREGDRHALDPDHAGVGRPCSPTARLDAVLDAHAVALELRQELAEPRTGAGTGTGGSRCQAAASYWTLV